MRHRSHRGKGKGHDAPKKRGRRRVNGKIGGEPRSELATGCQPNRLKSAAQTAGDACPGLNESRKPFREDLAVTINSITEELAHMQDEQHAKDCAGQICHHARILAMSARSRTV